MAVASFLDEIHRLQEELEKEETQRKAADGISQFVLIFNTKFHLFSCSRDYQSGSYHILVSCNTCLISVHVIYFKHTN